MTSDDLKFEMRFIKIKKIVPVPWLNIHAKFEGSIDKTMTCIVFTVSKTPISEIE